MPRPAPPRQDLDPAARAQRRSWSARTPPSARGAAECGAIRMNGRRTPWSPPITA